MTRKFPRQGLDLRKVHTGCWEIVPKGTKKNEISKFLEFPTFDLIFSDSKSQIGLFTHKIIKFKL